MVASGKISNWMFLFFTPMISQRLTLLNTNLLRGLGNLSALNIMLIVCTISLSFYSVCAHLADDLTEEERNEILQSMCRIGNALEIEGFKTYCEDGDVSNQLINTND